MLRLILPLLRSPRVLFLLLAAALVVCFLLSFVPGCEGPVCPPPPVVLRHRQGGCFDCHVRGKGLERQFPDAWKPWRAMDRACLNCHRGLDVHNPQAIPRDMPSCLRCHSEHHGPERVTEVSNELCAACHKSPPRRLDGRWSKLQPVPGWPPHPEFEPKRSGRRRTEPELWFPHKSHTAAKGVRGPGGAFVRLECAACHVADRAGRYMLPVKYDRSCASCHPLSVRLHSDPRDAQSRKVAAEFARLPALHGKPGAVVLADLLNRLLDAAREAPGLLGEPVPADNRWPVPRERVPGTEREWQWAQRQIDGLRHQLSLSGGCALCHMPEPGKAPSLGFRPTKLPWRALAHARFSHELHSRLTRCEECHSVADSTLTREVKLPSVQTCRQCHGTEPQRLDTAGDDRCTTCHTFHLTGKKKRAWEPPLFPGEP